MYWLAPLLLLPLAGAGAQVVLASRKLDRVTEAANAIRGAGGQALGIVADVREPEAVQAAVIAAVETFGGLDILIANAAGNFVVPFVDMSFNAWRTVVDIDLHGSFHCAKAAHPHLKRSRGAIVMLASMAGVVPQLPTGAYSPTKAALIMLTQMMAQEWAPDGIRVNALTPGLFPHEDHTQDMRSQRPEGYEAEWKRIPALRVGRVHELGWAATYLCSPYAAYLTGHNFVLDGAEHLRRGLRMPEFVPIRDQIPRRT